MTRDEIIQYIEDLEVEFGITGGVGFKERLASYVESLIVEEKKWHKKEIDEQAKQYRECLEDIHNHNRDLRRSLGRLTDEFNPQSMDALVWAKEFMRIYNDNHQADPGEWIDESLMLAWFANAIMAGYDEAQRRKD